MDSSLPPSPANGFHGDHAALLQASHLALLGRPLLDLPPGAALGRGLYEADFVLLSHGPGADPRFTYANLAAQALFGYPWAAFVGLPSRLSAEPAARGERERLLQRVAEHGFIDDYSGVRVGRTGQRFTIRRAVVWNLHDPQGVRCGQAACFRAWDPC